MSWRQHRPITDQAIGDAVEDEFSADFAVPEQTIHVDASEGIVTLTGLVDSLLAKEHAARIAETVKGVRAVVNNVAVQPSPLRATWEGGAGWVVNELRIDGES